MLGYLEHIIYRVLYFVRQSCDLGERKLIFDLACIWSCHRKHILKMSKKFQTKISRVHLDILCVHTKFHKWHIFVSSVKKWNKCLIVSWKAFFKSNFVPFNTKFWFFVKQLCKHIEHQDVRVIFFLINSSFKCVKDLLKNGPKCLSPRVVTTLIPQTYHKYWVILKMEKECLLS
jgi:hypothetical protein